MRLILYLFLIAFGMLSCNNKKPADDPDKFNSEHWLLGNWMYFSGNDTIIEQWTYMNGELVGVNNKLKNGDSIPNETVSIRLVEGNLVYEAKVNNQNNGEGVPFTLENYQDDKFVFTNLEHDFPQHISYELTHTDSCKATISGNINKQERKVDFSLVRIPD